VVFEGGLWLIEPDNNKAMIVTLWQTEEDMEVEEASGYYRQQLGKFGGLLAEEVAREAYGVHIRA
jgi:hypothetical protein